MARTYTVDAKRYNFINVDSNLVTSYLVTEADHNKWIKIDTTASSVNLNLPLGLSDGLRFVVENVGSTTVNYVNAVGTSIASQQDPFTEDQYRTTEVVYNAPTMEWRIQGFVGRNDVSSLYDVNTNANGTPVAGDVLQFNGSVWSTGTVPPYIPQSVISVDTILDETHHGKILPINTTALPVDIAINVGLPSGFYTRLINVGTGTLTLTSGATINSPITESTNQYDYIDLWHAGLEQYYISSNIASGGATAYIRINATGGLPIGSGNRAIIIGQDSVGSGDDCVAIGTDANCDDANSVAIGRLADTAGSSVAVGFNSRGLFTGVAIGQAAEARDASTVALGASAEAAAVGAVQIGAGINSVTNTFRYLTRTIANPTGIVASGDVSLPVGAGVTDGNIFLDTSEDQLYFYAGGNWKPAAANPFLAVDSTTFTAAPNLGGGASNIVLGPTSAASAVGNQIVIGANSTSSNIGSIVIGTGSAASADYVLSIGEGSDASALNSVAIGRTADTNANDSIAIGATATVGVTGTNSVQIGAGTNNTANTMQYLGTVVAGVEGIIADVVTAAPSAPAETGTMKFYAATDTLYIYNGTSWVSTILT